MHREPPGRGCPPIEAWNQSGMTVAMDAQTAIRTSLSARATEATICPSEAARVLATAAGGGTDWRMMMPTVHAAVDRLVSEGKVCLSWKGQALPSRAGPYRIGRGKNDD